MQQKSARDTRIVSSIGFDVHDQPMANDLEKAEEALRQAEPDLIREDDGTDVKRVGQRVDPGHAQLIARKSIVVPSLSVKGDINDKGSAARKDILFDLVHKESHQIVDQDGLEARKAVAEEAHDEGADDKGGRSEVVPVVSVKASQTEGDQSEGLYRSISSFVKAYGVVLLPR